MERLIDTSIRIKVINDCQWTCNFCHNEGTELPMNQQKRSSVFLDPETYLLPPVEKVEFNIDSLNQIASLRNVGINEVHLTGGEPTLHPALPQIVKGLSSRGFVVKMTTNGQGSNSLMKELVESGLSGVNFSILSFNPEEFLKTQKIKSIPWAERMIKQGKDAILYTQSLGIPVKINTVVLGKEDFARVDTIREFAETYQIPLVLLPSVGDRERTEPTVLSYAERYGVKVSTTEYTNNAKGSRRYVTVAGNRVDAKYLRPYHPDVVCSGCEHRGKDSCVEKFYGLRMEFRRGMPYVRMCIQKTNSRTVIPLADFLRRGVINQL